MDPESARALFATARVARLATVGEDGGPHLVPIVFALDGDLLYTAVDHKPKRTQRLRRLANIAVNPRVSVLADQYEDDWTRLWWVRADGVAHVVEPGVGVEHERAVASLAARYQQYAGQPPAGAAIVVEIARWSGWSAGSEAAFRSYSGAGS
jgi:PPOX class probable F420-dependent enzyme